MTETETQQLEETLKRGRGRPRTSEYSRAEQLRRANKDARRRQKSMRDVGLKMLRRTLISLQIRNAAEFYGVATAYLLLSGKSTEDANWDNYIEQLREDLDE